jgi:hypothetical protein
MHSWPSSQQAHKAKAHSHSYPKIFPFQELISITKATAMRSLIADKFKANGLKTLSVSIKN